MGDVVPQTERDIGEMWAERKGWVASFRDPDLKALVEAFLRAGEMAAALRKAPSAPGEFRLCPELCPVVACTGSYRSEPRMLKPLGASQHTQAALDY